MDGILLHVQGLLLNPVLLRFIHILGVLILYPLFVAEYCFLVRLYHTWFVLSPIDGRLDHF